MKYIKETFDVGKLTSDARMAEAKSGAPVRLVMSEETKQLLRKQTEYLWAACFEPIPSRIHRMETYCGCVIDTNHALPRGEVLITAEVSV